MKKFIFIFALLLYFHITFFLSKVEGQVTSDTLWSVPELDGGIDYRPGSGIYTMGTTGSDIGPGDGFDFFNQEEVFTRSYLAFNLDSLSIPDSVNISQAIVYVYQFDATGNDQGGVYPIWNVAGGDTHFCVLDHIDYGNTLDLSDWTAGNPGDPKTYKSNIGIISNNANVEYKTLDVTPYVIQDIQAGKTYNQYRMRFTIDRDFDLLGDLLLIRSGNSIITKPFLEINYNTNAIEIKPKFPKFLILYQNNPNPFNSETIINFKINKPGIVNINIYNVLGKKILNLVNTNYTAGKQEVIFNAYDLPSGLYYYTLKFNNQALTKKMLLLR